MRRGGPIISYKSSEKKHNLLELELNSAKLSRETLESVQLERFYPSFLVEVSMFLSLSVSRSQKSVWWSRVVVVHKSSFEL